MKFWFAPFAGFVLLQLLLTNAWSSNAQTNWKLRSDSLYSEYEQGHITSNKWWRLTQQQAGYFSSFDKFWVKGNEAISGIFFRKYGLTHKRGIIIVIGNWGWPYRRSEIMSMFIFNLTDSTILVPRKDATVDEHQLRQYVLLDGKWIQPKDDVFIPGCGNGYFNELLKPGCYHYSTSSTRNVKAGAERVQYRLGVIIEGQEYFSDSIEIRLHSNQLRRMREESQGAQA
jgi:hypothetical protein